MNKYLSSIVMATLAGLGAQAQQLQDVPRLVVNITIDQLQGDYIERFAALYGSNGFKRLFNGGKVYRQAAYSFAPVDRSAAIAAIATGASPRYNGISGNYWLNRSTLTPMASIADDRYTASPQNITCSTIGDELKMASYGNAIVYGIAKERDAAVLSAGHAADGAVWLDEHTQTWQTSGYYSSVTQKWVTAYNASNAERLKLQDNERVSQLALDCIETNAFGRDEITDYIAITLSAAQLQTGSSKAGIEGIYVGLDRLLGEFIDRLEQNVGRNNFLLMLTGTGYSEESDADYAKYKIPTGTFYINRSAALLNMYLAAVYGQGKYIEAYHQNQIYFNRRFIEHQHLSLSEIYTRSKDFLMQMAGVTGVERSTYPLSVSGDLIVEIAPGWKLLNEDTHQSQVSKMSFVSFPIIFYGQNIQAEEVKTPVTTAHIAPTIANAIHIRAPNACASTPLF